MAKINVHAGDFLEGRGDAHFGSFNLKTKAHSIMGETIPFKDLEEIDIASEDSVKRVGGTIGWGVAGAVVLGPVGLLAGLLMGGRGKNVGGRGKNVTFVAKFKDGRRLLATTDAKTFTKLKAAIF